MMPIVQSRRISKGGYSPGAEALIAGPSFFCEEEPPPLPIGPTPEEIESIVLKRIESARNEAFTEGFRRGVVEGRQAIEGEIALLRGYIAGIDSEIDLLWQKIERHTASLALEIGRKVVGEVVDGHSTLAVDLARRGIVSAREQTNLTLFVNPEDVAALKNASADLLKSAEGVRHIEIVERESVSRGGVIVECEVGQFDLRPDTQLQIIAKSIEAATIEIQHDA